MNAETERLHAEGLFDSKHGETILKSVQARPIGSDDAAGRSGSRGDSGSPGADSGANEGSQVRGAVLKPPDATPIAAEATPTAGSPPAAPFLPRKLHEGLKVARKIELCCARNMGESNSASESGTEMAVASRKKRDL